jgi:hypothetical protein
MNKSPLFFLPFIHLLTHFLTHLLTAFFVALGTTTALAAPDYQDGDLIFHQSQSAQSKAIHEATGSRWSHVGVLLEDSGTWYVAEATQPVRVVTLKSFIARGRGNHYRTYRLPGLTSPQKQVLRDEIGKMMGGDYDLYFEWTDDLIYCSELTYKAFLKATGVELGTLQKFKDLKLDGPYVKELIRRRIQDTGRTLNLEEPILTPISQMIDSDLKLIIQTGP